MADLIRIVVEGHRDAAGRFTRALDHAAHMRRQYAEEWAERMVQLARDESPKDTLHRDPRKAEPRQHFYQQWYAVVDDEGDYRGTITLDNRSPIRDYVLYPTKPHRIPVGGNTSYEVAAAVQKAKGYPLLWYDRDTGEPCRAWAVWHPGTKGNPVHERVIEELEEDLVRDLQRVAGQVAEIIVS